MEKGVVYMVSSRIRGLVAIGIATILLTACNGSDESVEPNTDQTQSEPDEQVAEEKPQEQELPDEQVTEENPQEHEVPGEGTPPTSMEAAATVMKILKAGDMDSLAAWAHREKGIRFSPYAYVDTEKNLVFSRDELKDLMEDTKVHEWGIFAGSGALIELTYADYHKKFVYDADFIEKAKIAQNEVLGEGTTTNNLNEIYPKETHDFVEYHIEGIDSQYDGMDWRSLRLVFEKIGDDHALVGIIHDQWTP
jgi:hypothetical protein